MTLVAGASRFLNQSALSSLTGSTFQAPSVLGTSTAGTANLLDVGRRNSAGIGLSSNARALNRQFVDSNASRVNGLFSLTGGGAATVEAAQTQIKALQSSVPVSRETPEVREALAEAAAERGSIVDESV